MADPGFPIRGCQPPTRNFLVKMYAEMKEIDPVGGCPPGSANRNGYKIEPVLGDTPTALPVKVSQKARCPSKQV